MKPKAKSTLIRVLPTIATLLALAVTPAHSDGDVGFVAQFRRADANSDGGVDISDASAILNWLFAGIGSVSCDDAADANDDGRIDLSDAVWILGYLFLGADQPPSPFDDCGVDTTPDELTCESFESCPVIQTQVDFGAFVLDLIDATSDTSDPVELNGLDFSFSDDPDVFAEPFEEPAR